MEWRTGRMSNLNGLQPVAFFPEGGEEEERSDAAT